MKDSKIKSSAEKIKMPNEVKTRIIDRCREVETTIMNENKDNREYTEHVFDVERVKERNILRTVSAVAACAVLVGGIGATGYYMNKQGRPHPNKGITDATVPATEVATKSAETTKAVTTTATVTQKAATTEAVTTSETAVTTTAVTAVKTEFSMENILKYVKVPDDALLNGAYYCTPVVTEDENGGIVIASVLENKLNWRAVDSFVSFMTSNDITEAEKQQSDKELAALLDFSIILPYNENISSTFEVYRNGICCMQVAENEVKGTGRENRIIEEYFFNIDNDALKFAIENANVEIDEYAGKFYMNDHNLRYQPEGYVCPTPSFEFEDASCIKIFSIERWDYEVNNFSPEKDKLACYAIFNSDENYDTIDDFREFCSKVFSGADWSAHEISENKAEMISLFNDPSVKFEYEVDVLDAQDNIVYEIILYTDGYIRIENVENGSSIVHTYKFENSDILDRFEYETKVVMFGEDWEEILKQ